MTDSMHKFSKALPGLFFDKHVVNKYALTEEDLNDLRRLKPKKIKIRHHTATHSFEPGMEKI